LRVRNDGLKHHPDRHGATLLQCNARAREAAPGEFITPAPGSADARIDLKLLGYAARRALAQSTAARARLGDLTPERRPDLWAGTVQDGTARGFAVVLEEIASLLPAEPRAGPIAGVLQQHAVDPLHGRQLQGKELRRHKDLLVSSGGVRVRFGHKQGLLLVDRARELESHGFVRFEDRADRGTLDAFVPDPAERARVFDPRFLQPVLFRQGRELDALMLEGTLGRGATGNPCQLAILGFKDEPFLRLQVRIDNRHADHRLRIRFLGLPNAGYVEHLCADVGGHVDSPAGGFSAYTLVRACGRLEVDGGEVPVPGAQCRTAITHEFRVGDRGAAARRG
jgi:hypothetical protein